jgi:hypothetical protein
MAGLYSRWALACPYDPVPFSLLTWGPLTTFVLAIFHSLGEMEPTLLISTRLKGVHNRACRIRE